MTKIQTYVNGVPIAQPRHRVTTARGFARAYIPADNKVHGWKNAVIASLDKSGMSDRRIDVPVQLSLEFQLPMPKNMKNETGHTIPHVKKPDIDNLVKAVMDAMTSTGVWRDDSLVWDIRATKIYAGEFPGVLIALNY